MSETTDRYAGLPFKLEPREAVTRIRKREAAELTKPGRPRTQSMAGFEDKFTDIVDYIVRITDEIWVDRAIGRIYDTYDQACSIYTQYGVTRSVEEVNRVHGRHTEWFSRWRGPSPQRGLVR